MLLLLAMIFMLNMQAQTYKPAKEGIIHCPAHWVFLGFPQGLCLPRCPPSYITVNGVCQKCPSPKTVTCNKCECPANQPLNTITNACCPVDYTFDGSTCVNGEPGP